MSEKDKAISRPPNLRQWLDDAIAKTGGWLTSPLLGKSYSTEDLLERPERIGSPEHVLGTTTSPLDILGIGPTSAVMLPFLRGNKVLQAQRLAKLKFPGPSDSILNKQLEYYKQKYPRYMSHATGVGTKVRNVNTVSGNLRSGFVRTPAGPEQGTMWKAQINVNPNLINTTSELTPINTLGHEVRHLGHSISNKTGLPSTSGDTYPMAYLRAQRTLGYENIPYEIAARAGGLRDYVKHVLGDRINQIPVNERTQFFRALSDDPSMQALVNNISFNTIRNQPQPRTEQMMRNMIEYAFNVWMGREP